MTAPADNKPHTGLTPPFPFDGIDSTEFMKQIQQGKIREIKRRIATGFYSRPEVVDETVNNIIKSGDIPGE
jgi:hypothetical protein